MVLPPEFLIFVSDNLELLSATSFFQASSVEVFLFQSSHWSAPNFFCSVFLLFNLFSFFQLLFSITCFSFLLPFTYVQQKIIQFSVLRTNTCIFFFFIPFTYIILEELVQFSLSRRALWSTLNQIVGTALRDSAILSRHWPRSVEPSLYW